MRIEVVAATAAHLHVHEAAWRPRLRAVFALDAEWTWLRDFLHEELPAPDRETYALTSLDGLEALMSLVFFQGHVYVERLAVAPQNRPSGGRRLRGAGAVLLLHAARRSMDTGRGGRVDLHSLEDPSTLWFYKESMGMVEVGSEVVDGQVLRRFELSSERASVLLSGKES